jgi:hypothetical protein
MRLPQTLRCSVIQTPFDNCSGLIDVLLLLTAFCCTAFEIFVALTATITNTNTVIIIIIIIIASVV